MYRNLLYFIFLDFCTHFHKNLFFHLTIDDFIKECAEDFTKDGIEQLTGTMLGAVTKTFFEKIPEYIEGIMNGIIKYDNET